MTASDLLRQIEADGARLSLTPSGHLRITGPQAEAWLPTLRQYEDELVAELRTSRRREAVRGRQGGSADTLMMALMAAVLGVLLVMLAGLQ